MNKVGSQYSIRCIKELLRFIFLIMMLFFSNKMIAQSVYNTPYTVVTIAGAGHIYGSLNGTNNTARFRQPLGVAMDSLTNLYVADQNNCTIRKVSPSGTNWVVTTIAGQVSLMGGTNDGTNTSALFSNPCGIAADAFGNFYIADSQNYTIRKMTPVGTNWVVTTIAGSARSIGTNDGTGSAARFKFPFGIAVDKTGNVFVSDGYCIRKLTQVGTNWVVTTPVGQPGASGSADGTNNQATLYDPGLLSIDSNGVIYIPDSGNSSIREIVPVGTNWVVVTLAGGLGQGWSDGINKSAHFNLPESIVVDAATNLYVGDGNGMIRKVQPVGTNWVVTTLAGLFNNYGTNDGTGNVARIGPGSDSAVALSLDASGVLYFSDTGNDDIRKAYHENVPASISNGGTNFGFVNGNFSFNLSAPPGQAIVIEVSTDLYGWQPIWTNLFGSSGTLSFTDSKAGSFSYRFYRALTP
jgi:hypothetical protein